MGAEPVLGRNLGQEEGRSRYNSRSKCDLMAEKEDKASPQRAVS